MTALHAPPMPADRPGSVRETGVFFNFGKPVGPSQGATTDAIE